MSLGCIAIAASVLMILFARIGSGDSLLLPRGWHPGMASVPSTAFFLLLLSEVFGYAFTSFGP